jgi:2-hydroxy fatty acid dioxygenase
MDIFPPRMVCLDTSRLGSDCFQCTNSPKLVPLPNSLTIPNLPPNAGTILCLLYAILYILLEPVAGGILAPLLLTSTALANYLTSTYGSKANNWALGVHVASWIAQFIGHGVFEGRAPALLDNIVQAVFLAPLFVWLEVLFAMGYRPGLKARLDKAVEEDIAKFRLSKAGGVTNGKPSQIDQTQGNGHVKSG